MTCTESSLREVIATNGGLLKSGEHGPDSGECCIFEARSVCLGIPWTDSPDEVGEPDIRPLNDGYRDSAQRTEAMIRLAVALDGWRNWDAARRVRLISLVTIQTVRQIISGLPGLPERIAQSCKDAETLDAAAAASLAAEPYISSADYAIYAISDRYDNNNYAISAVLRGLEDVVKLNVTLPSDAYIFSAIYSRIYGADAVFAAISRSNSRDAAISRSNSRDAAIDAVLTAFVDLWVKAAADSEAAGA